MTQVPAYFDIDVEVEEHAQTMDCAQTDQLFEIDCLYQHNGLVQDQNSLELSPLATLYFDQENHDTTHRPRSICNQVHQLSEVQERHSMSSYSSEIPFVGVQESSHPFMMSFQEKVCVMVQHLAFKGDQYSKTTSAQTSLETHISSSQAQNKEFSPAFDSTVQMSLLPGMFLNELCSSINMAQEHIFAAFILLNKVCNMSTKQIDRIYKNKVHAKQTSQASTFIMINSLSIHR